MIGKGKDAIQKYNMLTVGDEVAVGLSGGADSVALLFLLRQMAGEKRLTLRALHLNHLLRGEESERDEAFVRTLCKKLDIPLTVERVDIAALAKKRRQSVELCAREERYAFFDRACPKGSLPLGKIATAHTLSDSVETTLLNLTRGTGLRGLTGIPPVNGRIVRPLIGCTRREVEAFCRENGLDWITDSSNLSDDYSRNRIRHQVIPALEELNCNLPHTVERMQELLAEDAAYLDSLAADSLTSLELPLSPGSWNRQAFLALPEPVSGRVLRDILRNRDIPYSRERIDLLRETIRRGSGGVQLGEALFFSVEEDVFSLSTHAEEEERAYFERILAWEVTAFPVEIELFPGKVVQLALLEYEEIENIVKKHGGVLKNALDCDKIDSCIKFRQRLPGDRLRPTGRGCTKKLKQLFGEANLPASRRDELAVLEEESGGRLLWAEGFGADERAAVSAETRRAILLTPNKLG
ncbi:MAG: tRNA lysidine(34) synthetase TilS [Oscillospiraceae bacterium]